MVRRTWAALALFMLIGSTGVSGVRSMPPGVAAQEPQAQEGELTAEVIALVGGGQVMYRVTLKNQTASPVEQIYLAVGVPADVLDVQETGTPQGSWYRGIELGSAAWLAERVPAGGALGPFTYTARVLGPTPAPQGVFIHWLRPTDATYVSGPAAQSIAGLPPGATRIWDGVLPGYGEQWAVFDTLPVGPLFGVWAGKLLLMEYQVTQQRLAEGIASLPGTHGLPPVNHVAVLPKPDGHAGFLFSHYDFRLYFVPPEEYEAIGR